jgi:hypothetical protein
MWYMHAGEDELAPDCLKHWEMPFLIGIIKNPCKAGIRVLSPLKLNPSGSQRMW